jgi:hypothetical protein
MLVFSHRDTKTDVGSLDRHVGLVNRIECRHDNRATMPSRRHHTRQRSANVRQAAGFRERDSLGGKVNDIQGTTDRNGDDWKAIRNKGIS